MKMLSGLDGVFLHLETPAMPMHVGSLSLLEPPTGMRGGILPRVRRLYERRLHFWDWQARRITQTVDLGEEGLIPLEVRFHHDPDSTHGYVGAALSSTLWHWHKPNGKWTVEKSFGIPPVEVEGWPFPVPSLITDLLLSLDDRYLYLSNWLHGDIRQYDISNPSHPRFAGQVWMGGLLNKAPVVNGDDDAVLCLL